MPCSGQLSAPPGLCCCCSHLFCWQSAPSPSKLRVQPCQSWRLVLPVGYSFLHISSLEWDFSSVLKTENEHTLRPCCFRWGCAAICFSPHFLQRTVPKRMCHFAAGVQDNAVLRGSGQTAQLLLWLIFFFHSLSSGICNINSFSLPPRNPPAPQAKLSVVQKEEEPKGLCGDFSAVGQINTACFRALKEWSETLTRVAITVKELWLLGEVLLRA